MNEKSKNPPQWSQQELKSLMDFVDDTDIPESLRIWVGDKEANTLSRTFDAAGYQYYTARKKQKMAAGEKVISRPYSKRISAKAKQQQMESLKEQPGALTDQPWDGDQDRLLRRYIIEGKTAEEIANLMLRTPSAIRTRTTKLFPNHRKDIPVMMGKPVENYMAEHIDEYLKKHPEVLEKYIPIHEVAPTVEEKSQPTTNIIEGALSRLIQGTVIRIPILSVEIESDNLVLKF